MKFQAKERTAEPAAPVLTTAEAKTHLRVDHSDEDTYIDGLVAAATVFAEEFTGRSIITQTWVAKYARWPIYRDGFMIFQLARPKVQAITSVKYYNDSSVLTTLSDTLYNLESTTEGILTLTTAFAIPGLSNSRKLAIEIEYTAGYGDASTDVPALLVQAIRLMVKHFYEIRMPVLENINATKVPISAMTLLKLYRFRNL